MTASPGLPLPPAARARVLAVTYASFLLLGWSGLLVPALIRLVQRDFAQSDAGLGLFYFVSAVAYAAGSFGGGFATERLGRRPLLAGAAFLLAAGLAAEATTAGWGVFVVAVVPVGIGSGVIDGGMNALILDLEPRRPGAALNLLHLFFSLGAALSPFVAGRLVGAGADWQLILLGTAMVAVVIGALLATHAMPTGRRRQAAPLDPGAPGAPSGARRAMVPLVLLGLAIGCYVSAEIGASSWMVRFLSAVTDDAATSTLAAFWGGLAIGRLAAVALADRFPPVSFTTVCVLVAAGSLLGAVVAPWTGLSMVLFALTGLAFGPVYPMVMSIGGGRYPDRRAAVTGTLAGVAVVGGIAYPPLMGVISDTATIGVAMAGAGILAIFCGVAVMAAGATSRSSA